MGPNTSYSSLWLIEYLLSRHFMAFLFFEWIIDETNATSMKEPAKGKASE